MNNHVIFFLLLLLCVCLCVLSTNMFSVDSLFRCDLVTMLGIMCDLETVLRVLWIFAEKSNKIDENSSVT